MGVGGVNDGGDAAKAEDDNDADDDVDDDDDGDNDGDGEADNNGDDILFAKAAAAALDDTAAAAIVVKIVVVVNVDVAGNNWDVDILVCIVESHNSFCWKSKLKYVAAVAVSVATAMPVFV